MDDWTLDGDSGIYTPVYYGLRTTALVISCAICGGWAVLLIGLSLYHHIRYRRPDVWISGTADFSWFSQPSPVGGSSPRNARSWLIGESREREVYTGFVRPIGAFICRHTPWRRVAGVEPVWLSFLRGTIAFAFLLGLLAYACVQCISLPLQESHRSLPVRNVGIAQNIPNLEDLPVSLVSDLLIT